MRLSYGSKKLKKLFGEARVPRAERHRTPVVADGSGRVLWVPEVGRSVEARPGDDEEAMYLGIREIEGGHDDD